MNNYTVGNNIESVHQTEETITLYDPENGGEIISDTWIDWNEL